MRIIIPRHLQKEVFLFLSEKSCSQFMSFNIILFLLTLIGGSIPLWVSSLNEKGTNFLLAFSGSFLLSITLLHLLPETFAELGGHQAGLLVLTGFFVQLIIQRLTHGVEHGHTHTNSHHHHHHHHAHHHHEPLPIFAVLVGLSIHAFMEGIPLGFNYRMQATETALYLAVGAHKIPEAILLTTLIISQKGKIRAFTILVFFATITPLASLLSSNLGHRYLHLSNIIIWMIPVVAGAFIHIATTIFFESGTRHHAMTIPKVISILVGVLAGIFSLLV
jgi:zinc transporter ZupT